MMRSQSRERDRLLAERRRRRRRASPATMLPTKVRSCGRSGREARRLVAAPDDDVGGRFDLGDLVAVDHLLVAGEVEHLRARARATPGRSRTAPRCRARRRRARRFRPARSRSACRSVPSAPPARRAAGSAHRSDEPPISSTIVDTRPRSRSTHAPVSARPSIASRVPARTSRAASRSSAAGRTARA